MKMVCLAVVLVIVIDVCLAVATTPFPFHAIATTGPDCVFILMMKIIKSTVLVPNVPRGSRGGHLHPAD